MKTVKTALRRVGLNSLLLDRRLTALSAGERQRVALARALTLHPALIICDDPARTLPPVAAEHFFRLMADLRQHDGLTFVWLVAQPKLAAAFADWLGVLYQGRLIEWGLPRQLTDSPQHPYTRHWFGGGEPLADKPAGKGCPFHPHCPHVMPPCRERVPAMFVTPTTQTAACFLYEEGAAQRIKDA